MSKKVNSVLLVIHPTRNEALTTGKDLAKLLNEKNLDVYATIKLDGAKDFNDSSKVDLAVVLGGAFGGCRDDSSTGSYFRRRPC